MGMSEFAAMLRSAQADLRALEHMPDAYAFDEQIFGFHAQQACEKALKAWLMLLGCKPPHVHDLRILLQLLEDRGVVLDDALEIAALTQYAVRWRYGEAPADFLVRPDAVALCSRLVLRVAGLVQN